ncbi:transglutaminase family protein [Fundidesulfovibrio agrisoli]|uniref:transglutaminase family protein n=1 Tax=Fundidesulfovibrio agrisoli TaxID=2922717 RepID=UPI001FAD2A2D|nr:transglutaminase family protein [Fundidesulfovibrio agrisoli]
MLFTGEHEIAWRYSRPVFLEPHLVRLTPRQDGAQRLESFVLRVWPEPAGRCEITDADGNQACWLWFEGLHESLTVSTSFTARTLRHNPFDYLLLQGAEKLPLELSPLERAVLAPSLGPIPGAERAEGLGRELARAAGYETLAFLNELNARLYRDIAVTVREEPGVLTPDATLAAGCGACRDASLVFMAACRAVGLPARYLSCYQQGDADQPERDLHACVEVYLPGAGWRGYDPTLGLAVADAHLALCASPEPALTAPSTGSFRGTGAESELSHRIALTVTA